MPDFNAAEGCSRPLDTEYLRLVTLHAPVIQKFKEWCKSDASLEVFNETDFDGVALGFFIANGITGDSRVGEEVEDYYDALMLCTLVRYTYQYWMP